MEDLLKRNYILINKKLHTETWGIATTVFLILKLITAWIGCLSEAPSIDITYLIANWIAIFGLVFSFMMLVIPRDYGKEYDKMNKNE